MPIQGQPVLYVLPEHAFGYGVTRPAIVTQAWSETCANLHVMLDGANDLSDRKKIKALMTIGALHGASVHPTSVSKAAEGEGTWRDLEFVSLSEAAGVEAGAIPPVKRLAEPEPAGLLDEIEAGVSEAVDREADTFILPLDESGEYVPQGLLPDAAPAAPPAEDPPTA